MRVIDAHTGLDVHVGDCIALPHPGSFATPESSKERMRRGLDDYYYCVRAIREGWFSASMDAEVVWDGERRAVNIPLTVRRTHPGYPGEKVAFVPS